MTKTKLIYFLSSLVIIVGCYALNLSYSLFIQTEETNIVDSSVPILSYNLSTTTYQIPASTNKIIKLTVNNVGTSGINYGVNIPTLPTGILVKLIDMESNEIIGSTNGATTKDIYLYVENSNETPTDVEFSISANYDTLNFDNTAFLSSSNIDTVNKHQITLSENIIYLDNRVIKNETTPDYGINAITEDGLFKADDDYGESWYFRGSSSYNYVKFAGFIWRIVRINGDNTVRLILDGITSTTKKEGSEDFAGEDSGFNAFETDNSYVGYMYGQQGVRDYDLTHENVNDSSIKTKVDEFYTTYIYNELNNIDLTEHLADSLYCGDKTPITMCTFSAEWAYGDSSSKYAASARLSAYEGNFSNCLILTSNPTPTLKCAEGASNNYSRYTANTTSITSQTNTTINVNDDLDYPIGLLSADEIVFAGGFSYMNENDYNNTSYYLYNPLTIGDNAWWTMTPSGVNESSFARVYIGNQVSGLPHSYDSEFAKHEHGVRPVINLKSDSIIDTGDGTTSNPYQIKRPTS